MSKFKFGDKVKVTGAFPNNFNGSSVLFDGAMLKDVGAFGTIQDLKFDLSEGFHYVVFGDHAWVWHESGLELVVENGIPEFTTGMRVELRNGQIHLVVVELKKFYDRNGFMPFEAYNQSGNYLGDNQDGDVDEGDEGWDIVKVYSGSQYGDMLNLSILGALIWQDDSLLRKQKEEEKQKRIAELKEILWPLQTELRNLEGV